MPRQVSFVKRMASSVRQRLPECGRDLRHPCQHRLRYAVSLAGEVQVFGDHEGPGMQREDIPVASGTVLSL